MPTKRPSLEKFTQFLNDRHHWQTIPKLKANMQKLMRLLPHQDEKSWFRHFLQQARERACPHASEHLRAYLEEICYGCAWKIRDKFKAAFKKSNDYLNEYFQDARLIVCDVIKFWRKYNAELDSAPQYARVKVERILTEIIFAERQDKPTSGYGSLVRVSEKRLSYLLMGLSQDQRSQYLLVHSRLREIQAYLPRIYRTIQEPTPAQLEEIARCCHVEVIEIKKILEDCIKALESARPRPEVPLDPILISGENPEDGATARTRKDFIDASFSDSPDVFILQPLENSRILSILLGGSIASLDNLFKKIPKGLEIVEKLLVLSYGFAGVNQTLIGKDLAIKQHDVSRWLKKAKRAVIEELADLAAKHPQIKLDVEGINTLGNDINIFLAWYYQQQVISKVLENALRSHSSLRNGINTLMIYFSYLPPECARKLQDVSLPPWALDEKIAVAKGKLNLYQEEIARRLQITTQEIGQQVDTLVGEGVQYLANWLQERFNITREIVSNIQECLYRAVYIFMCNAPYSLLVA